MAKLAMPLAMTASISRCFFFSSRRRHTRSLRDWSSDVCSSDLDLLHVHYAIPHSVSALLARQMLAAKPRGRRLPFVTTLHGTDITLVRLDRSYLPITRFSIEQSDGDTAVSQYLKERTMRELAVRNNIQVI